MNRLVVVSNRVPSPEAGAQAGGLAVALGGLLERRGGLWFGWSGRVAREGGTQAVDVSRAGRVDYATIDLAPEEHRGFYNHFSNGVLWPLLHTLPELMAYSRRDAVTYRQVNERFSEALVPLLTPNDHIWIHDYHLFALPALLRARGVRNPIGFFLHIPFAATDVLATAPDMPGLIKDMLAADLIGFQTANDAANFANAAEKLVGATRTGRSVLRHAGRRAQLGVFPVEIDTAEFAATAADSLASTPAERLRRSLVGQKLILGVDRLDPTKGLVQRVAGLRRLFEKHPMRRRRVTMLQIAAVSRGEVASYRALRAELDAEAGRLNSDVGDPDWSPLRLVARAGERSVMAGYMRQAQVGLVTPLRDGMNLVAKEFVAAQDPEDPGVLILSRFAGAAQQLDSALLVNPHDPDAMADALEAALAMELPERQARWRAMWRRLEHTSSTGWGRSFVAALTRAQHPEPPPSRARPGAMVEPFAAARVGLDPATLLRTH